MGITVISSLALACVITLIFLYLIYPPIEATSVLFKEKGSEGWIITYWIEILLMILYLIVYIIYMAVLDKRRKVEIENIVGNENTSVPFV